MVDRNKRNSVWFVVLFVAMITFGVCSIGWWMTYDLKCQQGQPVWVWTRFPPQFECRLFV